MQVLKLRLALSQPRGRSLSGQYDFPPPGFVTTVTLHKTGLLVLLLGKSPLSRMIPGPMPSLLSNVTGVWTSGSLPLPTLMSGMWGLSTTPLTTTPLQFPLLYDHLSKNKTHLW